MSLLLIARPLECKASSIGAFTKLIENSLCSQVIKEDVDFHVPLYEDIQQRGIDMLTRTDNAADRHQLRMRLRDVENRWKNLKAGIDERQKSLGRLVPSVLGYIEVREQVVALLSESEKKLDELALGQGDVSDMAAMTEKQEQLKVQCCISFCYSK